PTPDSSPPRRPPAPSPPRSPGRPRPSEPRRNRHDPQRRDGADQPRPDPRLDGAPVPQARRRGAGGRGHAGGAPHDLRLPPRRRPELPAQGRRRVSAPGARQTAETAEAGGVLRARVPPGVGPHQLRDGGGVAELLRGADRGGAGGGGAAGPVTTS